MELSQELFDYRGEEWRRIPEHQVDQFVVGCDLGQSQDSTAICVMHHTRRPLDEWKPDERRQVISQRVEERFDVRYLQRIPLQTPYPRQVAIVQELLGRAPLFGEALLAIDQTGCGAPVGDIFEASGLEPLRITFTAGHEAQGKRRKWGVPKSVIVSGLDAKLNTGELRFAKDLLEADALKEEMQNFQRHVSQTGRLLFEHRTGKHDDLVFSVGISLWAALHSRRGRIVVGSVRGLNY
jgi:hypothetical protein